MAIAESIDCIKILGILCFMLVDINYFDPQHLPYAIPAIIHTH